MKFFLVSACTILFLSACGNDSKSSGDQSGQTGQATQKKVQPGDSLTFTCPDSSHGTNVKLVAAWDTNAPCWNVSLDERDSSGNQILALTNLVGMPDDMEELHMNIKQNSTLYALVFQIGQNQAQYRDGNRILNCTFE